MFASPPLSPDRAPQTVPSGTRCVGALLCTPLPLCTPPLLCTPLLLCTPPLLCTPLLLCTPPPAGSTVDGTVAYRCAEQTGGSGTTRRSPSGRTTMCSTAERGTAAGR